LGVRFEMWAVKKGIEETLAEKLFGKGGGRERSRVKEKELAKEKATERLESKKWWRRGKRGLPEVAQGERSRIKKKGREGEAQKEVVRSASHLGD